MLPRTTTFYRSSITTPYYNVLVRTAPYYYVDSAKHNKTTQIQPSLTMQIQRSVPIQNRKRLCRFSTLPWLAKHTKITWIQQSIAMQNIRFGESLQCKTQSDYVDLTKPSAKQNNTYIQTKKYAQFLCRQAISRNATLSQKSAGVLHETSAKRKIAC